VANDELEKIVREYIEKSIHMSLATCINNQPWVCEVHFAYDNDLNLYFRSKPIRRHSQEIAENPNVAGNIVKQHDVNEYPHAVYFEGRAEVVKDESQYQLLYELFAKRQNVDESIIDDAKQEGGHRFYKIAVKNWAAFGKFGRESGGKYLLEWNSGVK
jgi:uncharacterized protein YhbP (UPF0306 family)